MLSKLVNQMRMKNKITFTEEEMPEIKDLDYDKGGRIPFCYPRYIYQGY